MRRRTLLLPDGPGEDYRQSVVTDSVGFAVRAEVIAETMEFGGHGLKFFVPEERAERVVQLLNESRGGT